MKYFIFILLFPSSLLASTYGFYASEGVYAEPNTASNSYLKAADYDTVTYSYSADSISITDLGISYDQKYWGLDLGGKYINTMSYNLVTTVYSLGYPGDEGYVIPQGDIYYTGHITHYGFYLAPKIIYHPFVLGVQVGDMISQGQIESVNSYSTMTVTNNYNVTGQNIFFQPFIQADWDLSKAVTFSLNLSYLFLNLKNLNTTLTATQTSNQIYTATPPPHDPWGSPIYNPLILPNPKETNPFETDLNGFSICVKLSWKTVILPSPPKINLTK